MSVASRIQEIETHIEDIYDTLEVGGTDLTDLNKNIVNINSSLKDRYKYFLNNGVEVIWNNWEKVIGEGTEFTLENTIQAPMKIDLKGNTYQKSTTGKNLFDISKVLNNGTRVVNNGDGTLSVQAYGSSGGAPSYLKTYCPNLKVGDNVILTLETTSTNKFIYLSGTNQSWKSGVERTITQSDLDSSVLWYSNDNSTPATISNIMVRLSSITDDTYEPYTNGASPNPDYPQDIQVVSGDNTITIEGKNLFDKSKASINYTLNWVTGKNHSESGSLASDFIPTTIGTQYKITYSSQVMYYDKNKEYLGCLQVGGKTIAKTIGNIWSLFTTPNVDEIAYMRLGIRKYSDGGEDKTNKDIMLNYGNTLATYEPYQGKSYPISLGNIELCEIGDYQDYFYKDNGKWYLKKNIGKVVLDGSESWSDFSVGDTNFRCQYDVALPNILTPPTNPAQLFSNYFKAINRDNAYAKTEIGIAQYGSALDKIFICAPNTILSEQTLASWKNWLSTHNTEVYYILATPTYTEITDTTLLSQLEAIKYSYDDQTNISQVNNDMPFKLEVTALKNI